MTAFSNALIALLVLKLLKKEPTVTGGAPHQEWMLAAFAYLGSHLLNYVSLRYIIFPLQVLVKSCKACVLCMWVRLRARVVGLLWDESWSGGRLRRSARAVKCLAGQLCDNIGSVRRDACVK